MGRNWERAKGKGKGTHLGYDILSHEFGHFWGMWCGTSVLVAMFFLQRRDGHVTFKRERGQDETFEKEPGLVDVFVFSVKIHLVAQRLFPVVIYIP